MKKLIRPQPNMSKFESAPDAVAHAIAESDKSPEAPLLKIRVLFGYRGRLTQEQFIPAGVYPEDDPILCGLADYLVSNGHAVYVE